MPIPASVIETPPASAEGTPPVVEDKSTDEFGYKIVPVEGTPPEAAKPAAEAPPEKPATGYGKAGEKLPEVPAAVVPPVPEKKPEDMTAEEKTEKELQDTVKALGDGFNKENISKFVKEHNLTKAQLDAYVQMRNGENEQFVKDQASRKIVLHNGYKKELMEDPEFGGENFDKNVDRTEKLLDKYMPNTKKMLTDKHGVLPPYIMRDLLTLSKALNPIAKHIGGEPPAPPEDSGDFIEDMYGKQSN